jgi:hypothetical protein
MRPPFAATSRRPALSVYRRLEPHKENHMAERVSRPYRGYAAAGGIAEAPIYVGAVSVAQRGPNDAHRFEALVDLGSEQRFATEDEALAHVEQAARDYIDRLLSVT